MIDPHPRSRPAIRLAWRIAGIVALALGAVGVVLPLLPTTPFAILAAFCFARGAPALHDRLLRSRTFGPAIADWQHSGAIARRYKAVAVTMMGAAFLLALAASVPPMALAVQAVCLAGAALFVLTRPGQVRTGSESPPAPSSHPADRAAPRSSSDG
ncbi:YbaN family protein [Oceaniovalibus guishaninsula]|uniref:YbaN family protein n=1 Tax=Oceaniovalibus guishaninsula TaxID=1046117 RepID=UPI0026B5BA4E